MPHRKPAFVRRLDLAFRQKGQDVVEYGLMIASIVIVVLLGVTTFGQQVLPWFRQLAQHITTVGT